MKSTGKWQPSELLLQNCFALGLTQTVPEWCFLYKSCEVDLSASADDQLSIMKNVATQLAAEIVQFKKDIESEYAGM